MENNYRNTKANQFINKPVSINSLDQNIEMSVLHTEIPSDLHYEIKTYCWKNKISAKVLVKNVFTEFFANVNKIENKK